MHFGDVIHIDFGTPIGSEAGFVRPAVVATADAFLRYRPSTVFVVPLTSTKRAYPSHVEIGPDSANGLTTVSWAQAELMRAVSTQRCGQAIGNVGPVAGHQLLDVLAMIIGIE